MASPNIISVASLLNAKYRKKLDNQGLLRPMANETDVIWQQMTLKNFSCLIDTKQLHLKAHSEYSDYDEVKLYEHVKPLIKENGNPGVEAENKLISKYNDLERHMFISCWFNSRYLSDIVFNAYAKSPSGIAIGTTVKNLMDQLHIQEGKIQNIVSGNVQYIPRRDLLKGSLFEPSQIYAPIFLKGMQFRLDHEFRVCVFCEQPQDLGVSPAQLIQYIAVKMTMYLRY